MTCVTLVKAVLARFLFGLHILVTVWRLKQQEGDSYWMFAIGILLLILEGLHSLCYRRGEELKWFCPSVFLYLCSIVPAIWILELGTDRREILCRYIQIVKLNENDEDRKNMLLDLMQLGENDYQDALNACPRYETNQHYIRSGTTDHFLMPDLKIKLKMRPEQWTRILEQIVLLVLILGRWLLPKAGLSRDQFSQLMVVYLGAAADIAEIFESFRESKVMLERNLTFAILGVWSWSLIQYCMVLGTSNRPRKNRASTIDEENAEKGSKKKRNSSVDGIHKDKIKRIKMDMIVIASNLLLQDGPFFCLRMTLIFRFEVISHMNIFFTCKNTLLILIQMYRFLVLCLERRPRYRRQSRLMSMIPPSAFLNDINDDDFECSIKDPEAHDKVTNIENSNEIGEKSSLKPKESVDDSKIKRKIRKNGSHKTNARNRSRQRTQFKHANTIPSTGSDDLPKSTSDDSENVNPMAAKVPSRGGSEKLRLSQLQRKDSLRSIASQFSIDSVHEAVKDKEEKWRQRHENSVKRQVRLQTLI